MRVAFLRVYTISSQSYLPLHRSLPVPCLVEGTWCARRPYLHLVNPPPRETALRRPYHQFSHFKVRQFHESPHFHPASKEVAGVVVGRCKNRHSPLFLSFFLIPMLALAYDLPPPHFRDSTPHALQRFGYFHHPAHYRRPPRRPPLRVDTELCLWHLVLEQANPCLLQILDCLLPRVCWDSLERHSHSVLMLFFGEQPVHSSSA